MKIVYLPRVRADVAWMRRYYESIFPEGYKRARQEFRAIETLLIAHPHAGHLTEFEGVREISVSRTPFSFIYRVREGQIEVLRMWDNRADRASMNPL